MPPRRHWWNLQPMGRSTDIGMNDPDRRIEISERERVSVKTKQASEGGQSKRAKQPVLSRHSLPAHLSLPFIDPTGQVPVALPEWFTVCFHLWRRLHAPPSALVTAGRTLLPLQPITGIPHYRHKLFSL